MLFLLATAAAFAAEAQRWAVSGVARGDTLTVRQEPGAKARALGKLAPDATGLEQLAEDESGWVKVRAGKLTGWVNGRYLTPELPSTGTLPTKLTCSGTEPFWGVALDGAAGTYTSPEAPKGVATPITTVRAMNSAAFLVTAAPGGGWSWLTVELAPDTCSDGMSDRRHPYRALAATEEQGFVAGCCRMP